MHFIFLIFYNYAIRPAREGSRKLQALSGMHRTAIVNRLADLLLERKEDILAANQQDVQEAFAEGIFVSFFFILF